VLKVRLINTCVSEVPGCPRVNNTTVSEPAVCFSEQGSDEEDEDCASGEGDADSHGKPEEP
jgi:hypothetical protein